MHAHPSQQHTLLQLQELDTLLAQVAHRRDTLPQQQELMQAQAQVNELGKQLVAAQTELSDLERERARSDSDVDQVRQRIERDQQQLTSGQLGPKDLQAMEHEVASLHRRQAELEDIELDIMQRVEDADQRIHALEEQIAQAQHTEQQTGQACQQALEDLDAQASQARTQREQLAPTVAQDLLDLYQRKVARTGRGAGLLQRNRCGACQMELMGAELSQVRQADAQEVLTHEDCGAILVRTAESGL